MEDDELVELTSDYGTVLRHDLWKDRDTKCGWVEYSTGKEARRCLEELDDRRMDDWHLRIKACIRESYAR